MNENINSIQQAKRNFSDINIEDMAKKRVYQSQANLLRSFSQFAFSNGGQQPMQNMRNFADQIREENQLNQE